MSSLLLKKEYQQDEDIEYDLRSDDPEEQSIATVDIHNYEDPLEPPNRADSLTPEKDEKEYVFNDEQRNLIVVAVRNFSDGIKIMMQQTWEESYKLSGIHIEEFTNQRNSILDSLEEKGLVTYTENLIKLVESPSSDSQTIVFETRNFIGTVYNILYKDKNFTVQYIYGIDRMIGFFHQHGFLYDDIPFYGFICDIICVPIYTLLSKTEFYDQYLSTISDSRILKKLDTRSIILSAIRQLSKDLDRPETTIRLSQNDPSLIEKISNFLFSLMKFRVTDKVINDTFLEIANKIENKGYDSQSISIEITDRIASKIVDTGNTKRLDDSIVGFKWMTIDDDRYTGGEKNVLMLPTLIFIKVFQKFLESKPILDARTFIDSLRQYLAVNYVLHYINKYNIKYINFRLSSLYRYYKIDFSISSGITELLRNYI